MNIETFASMNKGWQGNLYLSTPAANYNTKKNFEIARDVIGSFYAGYNWNSDKPQVGDVVEFSDGFRVYPHGYVERINEHGLAELCEQGHSFMGVLENGRVYFSTSGGAFPYKHISLFVPDGAVERRGWTWGCYGAGANQGIEFTFKVKKWKIPYPSKLESNVTIHFYTRKYTEEKLGRHCPIEIRSTTFIEWEFKNFKAYKAWADYVGFDYDHNDLCPNAQGRRCLYRMENKYAWKTDMIPDGCKKVVGPNNGRMCYVFIKNDGQTITTYRPSGGLYDYYVLKGDELENWRKYDGNPMGV